jgi:glycosyltransferase involved in cell wall biosynthesis
MKPSQWLKAAAAAGFTTVYTPHGMLEPWSMQQKALKKQAYFWWRERSPASTAQCIRAVSRPESERLQERFPKSEIRYIPNGAPLAFHTPDFTQRPYRVLFVGRLHHKKAIVPLVKAWRQWKPSPEAWQLHIAGPDEGELDTMRPFLGEGVHYHGAVYGDEKKRLMQSAHAFALPSFSEGFPTSVVEALGYGLMPLISEGCNFPEAIEAVDGLTFPPDQNAIEASLRHVEAMPAETLQHYSHQANALARAFDLREVARKLDALYQGLLEAKRVTAS